jgi:hypothetical protein
VSALPTLGFDKAVVLHFGVKQLPIDIEAESASAQLPPQAASAFQCLADHRSFELGDCGRQIGF